MSKFNRPHSFGPIRSGGQLFKPRTYPYILEKTKDHSIACEACSKPCVARVLYYETKDSKEAYTVYLCSDHERLTRYGKFDQVFRDIDRKCDGGKK